ncbi:hypothetical protein B0A49_09519 [Cryomyces minteri]|uniref:LysM domain-containing protein n=1 Tax=Cryomyces minteri TaxID=331657 RepID=A0A4U0WDN5_9PEZI|nr:hypothetical protein B0A49_09519 [Cryomyces minteri]
MSTSIEACCTCASLLHTYDAKTEKPIIPVRRLSCCDRQICSRCITSNPRFSTYCPYCQISTEPSPLPQGLRDPPAYSPPSSPRPHRRERSAERETEHETDPPAYTTYISQASSSLSEKPLTPAPDVLHFVDGSSDSVASLSLRYGVPANALRTTNNLYSDHLLAARRTILIPGKFYKGGVSLSPRPIEGEEEELRKAKIRKWMVACKVAEYDVALLYLQQAEYNLDEAIEAFKEDEKWEKEHPLVGLGKGKKAQEVGRRRFIGNA